MEKSYQIVGETSYHLETPAEIVRILEDARTSRRKLRLFYGKDGKVWADEFDVIGKIGRSMGPVKVPLLIHNARSTGGGALLDHCIVRIDAKDRNGRIVTLYKAEGYPDPTFQADGCVVRVAKDAEGFYAICKSEEKAARLAGFMNGTRWAK